MSTITKSHAHSSMSYSSEVSFSGYQKFISKLEFSHFALISMSILVVSCMGGIASMFVFQNHAPFWQFCIGLSVSMANLIACISQAPTKWVVNLSIAAILVNVALILANL